MDKSNQRANTVLKPIRWRKPLYTRLEREAKKQGTSVPSLVQDILEANLPKQKP